MASYNYSKVVDDFPELDPQSDMLSTVIPAPDGIAWVGSNQGLFRLDARKRHLSVFLILETARFPGKILPHWLIPRMAVSGLQILAAVNATEIGLCWFDGTEFGIFPVQDGGLPHAQITDVEVKEHLNGYELWMSCLSRGIAVLDVINDNVGIETINFPRARFIPAELSESFQK